MPLRRIALYEHHSFPIDVGAAAEISYLPTVSLHCLFYFRWLGVEIITDSGHVTCGCTGGRKGILDLKSVDASSNHFNHLVTDAFFTILGIDMPLHSRMNNSHMVLEEVLDFLWTSEVQRCYTAATTMSVVTATNSAASALTSLRHPRSPPTKVIVTSTYHGMFWGTLLQKKVVLVNAFSSKFFTFRYPPSIFAGDLDAAISHAKVYPQALEECQSANVDFYKLVNSLVSATTGTAGL